MIRPITAEALQELIAKHAELPKSPGHRLFVWDVRAAEAYLAGHIPGARQLPHHDVVRWVPQSADSLDTLVLVDADGAAFGPAREVAHELFHRWFRNVRYLAGGFAGWAAKGLPVEAGGTAGPGSASADGATPLALTSGNVPWDTGRFEGVRHPIQAYAPPGRAKR
jgi:rhodanese-related sulfurtransferase